MKSSKYQHIDDKELLDNYYRDGDNEWLGILLPRYTLMLYGVCMKYLKDEELARDSVQQVFLKVLNELKKYRVDYFKSWVYILAKNHCLMQLRTKATHFREVNENLLQTPPLDEEQMRLKEKERSLDNMKEALVMLNDEQRICVTLFYLEKKSYHEISSHTQFTLSQVKSHIQNGKRNLRINLERMNQNEK